MSRHNPPGKYCPTNVLPTYSVAVTSTKLTSSHIVLLSRFFWVLKEIDLCAQFPSATLSFILTSRATSRKS
eukprot:SAG25_NODE_1848_length_2262_cov_2.766528_1_plen_71_part_00